MADILLLLLDAHPPFPRRLQPTPQKVALGSRRRSEWKAPAHEAPGEARPPLRYAPPCAGRPTALLDRRRGRRRPGREPSGGGGAAAERVSPHSLRLPVRKGTAIRPAVVGASIQTSSLTACSLALPRSQFVCNSHASTGTHRPKQSAVECLLDRNRPAYSRLLVFWWSGRSSICCACRKGSSHG